ncbi:MULTISPECIES: ABC transporter substrate-binding protein [unclassified Parafrankia]|uniref:ABC transporter substrate-binding protein n=1 Tax=Parafrankia TaxID=2994362 RepID=UPI000DA4D4A0|nr:MULTISPECIES: ABC transporter substrate-binding protein [unclassified Parafrankia]CAI7974835.1 Branched-chain amino acid ABC transporter substrate-binding protein [Frankia sp. Hr75.2]SQE00155.1 putative branched-chain amino acid transport system [Parafrankia sp. Ea1.12]
MLGPSAPAQGEPVRIGLVTDGKSAGADTSVEPAAADATVAFLNERRSGIGGRPIELVKCETLGDPAKGTDCGNQMIEEDVVAVLMGNSAVSDSVWEPLHEGHVPVVLFASSGAGPLADGESTFILTDSSFAVIDLPVQLAEERDATKVTSVVIDVPAALNLVQNVAPALFEDAGIDFDLVPVPPGTADMTPQMQNVVDGDTGVVFIVGNDAFCISAMNGLRAVGYEGQISAISQCITDATRKGVPGDLLEGTVVAASAPIGLDNSSTRLYNAVVETYGDDVDTSQVLGMSMFTTISALQSGVEGITGDVTSESIIAALKSMPEKDLPGVEGMRFRCNGKADPKSPSVCVRGGLVTTLNSDGQPAEYKALGVTPIED